MVALCGEVDSEEAPDSFPSAWARAHPDWNARFVHSGASDCSEADGPAVTGECDYAARRS